MTDFNDKRTPSGRPINFPIRTREFIQKCIDDDAVAGMTLADLAEATSTFLDYPVTEGAVQFLVKDMGYNWMAVRNASTLRAIETILRATTYRLPITVVQASLEEIGIRIEYRSCVRRVAEVRAKMKRDNERGT